MSVNGIEAVGYPVAGYETRKTERNILSKKFADEIASARKKNGESQTVNDSAKIKSLQRLHCLKDEVNQLSELEDKYCSLCGSMIDADGSCPICIVPTFISGNKQARNQDVSQANNSYLIIESKLAVFSKSNKIGRI